ncbi:tetratricopeptide repeat protein [Methyloligella sp. 2.7D]|uniref:tetratricopeptide repeat protein n=1 Tax=unclassified Methyloligella TaxID=2625955 RepID=UPI00157D4752|nr:tetratricopeptide repeat protein [Methyloligella sp. GL2]QKP77251.1 tetratricopeptide repeat protein [Methyloligella sp. GL2]
MSDGDLFREVDEAIRHERYRLLWAKYGSFVIAFALLIVVVVAGYKGWVYWQKSQADTAGASFTEAVALAESGDKDKAREAFQKLAEDGPSGYATLARFRLAAEDVAAGNTEEAVTAYDAIANDGSVDSILRNEATIQAASLRLPGADYAEMERRLNGLLAADNPWRYSAQDLLGLSAYRLKDIEAAQKHFSALMVDSGTPNNLRERANMMLTLLAGETAASSAGEDKAAGETPAAASSSDATPSEGTPSEEAPAADESASGSAESAPDARGDAADESAETPADSEAESPAN